MPDHRRSTPHEIKRFLKALLLVFVCLPLSWLAFLIVFTFGIGKALKDKNDDDHTFTA